MVRDNRRAATAAVLLGFFVVMLDVTVVNVALGGIGAAAHEPVLVVLVHLSHGSRLPAT